MFVAMRSRKIIQDELLRMSSGLEGLYRIGRRNYENDRLKTIQIELLLDIRDLLMKLDRHLTDGLRGVNK